MIPLWLCSITRSATESFRHSYDGRGWPFRMARSAAEWPMRANNPRRSRTKVATLRGESRDKGAQAQESPASILSHRLDPYAGSRSSYERLN
ncbi:hypothetical protein [Azospirillum largimobile]